ncbi:hypothetical protein IV203_020070 [Nitzschia inconspicua]|uniref:Uncharacterized protein n=1 Tax=Nitzschia inconspicua TaxID=303405 RepID=A0A9K3Q5V0_9STRA|nr:hypothetical protein IV203_020070 [Nitzschia inconspicua]
MQGVGRTQSPDGGTRVEEHEVLREKQGQGAGNTQSPDGGTMVAAHETVKEKQERNRKQTDEWENSVQRRPRTRRKPRGKTPGRSRSQRENKGVIPGRSKRRPWEEGKGRTKVQSWVASVRETLNCCRQGVEQHREEQKIKRNAWARNLKRREM